MPASREQRYDPVPPIPTYDEAIAMGDHRHPPLPPIEAESQSLLTSDAAPSSSRRTSRYRPPTVETDDEDSEWTSEDDETQVRREIQEMEMEEEREQSRSSIWGKRIPFSLSLPWGKWTWRWRLPLPRTHIRLPSGPDDGEDGPTADESRRRWTCPKISGATAIIVFARILAVLIVILIIYLIFATDFFASMARRLSSGVHPNPEVVRIYLQDHLDERRMEASVRHFTHYAHIAGTEGDFATAEDVERMFTLAGLDEVAADEYFVYLNYPKDGGRAVEIMGQDGNTPVWAAQLEEIERGSETAGRQTLVFHGLSKSGDVKGPLIYANYGSRDDFKRLADSGVDTKGAIALVWYYGTQEDPGLKVKAAELAGFAGCIIYSDPADDGFRLGDVAPQGPFMPVDGVQRSSVGLSNWVIGDVLTPGWPSKKGQQQRMQKEATKGLVQIPSLPIASRDAKVLLQHLKGFGVQLPQEWVGGVPDVDEWWSGNSSSPIVHLKNEQDEVEQKEIWNIYGKIRGTDQEQASVIIGNHRDAWAFGGTNPHSGTAVMIEMARIMGDLVSIGWKPLRTIEFMSWDGGAYNHIGSTEFVENNEEYLRKNAYAYINLDNAVGGTEFRASGSPVFNRPLLRALNKVWDPRYNTTMRDIWDRRSGALEALAGGSDYVPFQCIAGASSIDVGFRGTRYPQHSSYDNFEFVQTTSDPGFSYHLMVAQIVGLLILEFADEYILPFDLIAYGDKLDFWVQELEIWAKNYAANENGHVNVQPLRDAVQEVKAAANAFFKWEMVWDSIVMGGGGGGWESNSMTSQRHAYNDKMAQFETALLDLTPLGGIPNREQFKHVVFGPQRWATKDAATFPAIRDSIEDLDWDLADKLIARTADIVKKAAAGLLA